MLLRARSMDTTSVSYISMHTTLVSIHNIMYQSMLYSIMHTTLIQAVACILSVQMYY